MKCPKLYLAPMEGVATWFFRKALTTIGGFDEACTEFIRVPMNAACKLLSQAYQKDTTYPIAQAAQIMGSEPELMAEMTGYLIERGAPRVDLNCGCPSNVVTGKGAGSSLLKTPSRVYDILKAMKKASSVPITIKMRAGFEDTSLFEENLKAIEEAGPAFITIHPRTKVQGYTGSADWSLIKKAKSLIQIPIVGNGDIKTADDAHRMLTETGCDALMIGRGVLMNPWLFHEIKASFNEPSAPFSYETLETYIETYLSLMPKHITTLGSVCMLKQLYGYLLWGDEAFLEKRKAMLRKDYNSNQEFLEFNAPALKGMFVKKAANAL